MSRPTISPTTPTGTVDEPKPTRESNRPRSDGGWAAIIVLIIGGMGMVVPFLWMFSTSMRLPGQAFDLPPKWLPFPIRTLNYDTAINGVVPLLHSMLNSAFVAITVSIAQIILCPLAGYAFARLKFWGSNALFVMLLAGLMVPLQVTIIPLFIVMKNLNLLDSLWSLILPSLTSAFGVFLMRQFFLGLPQEILDASKIDGASAFTTYRLVALPLAKPGLTTLGVITLLASWNSYFMPLIFLKDLDHSTMPLALVAMLGPYGSGNVAAVMAATTIAIFPALVVFLIAQRWIIASLTSTGVKG